MNSQLTALDHVCSLNSASVTFQQQPASSESLGLDSATLLFRTIHTIFWDTTVGLIVIRLAALVNRPNRGFHPPDLAFLGR
jgi:hypothetical protein